MSGLGPDRRGFAQQPKGVARIASPDTSAATGIDTESDIETGPRGPGRTSTVNEVRAGLGRLFSGSPGQLARERAWSAAISRRPAASLVVAFVAGKGGVGTTSAAAGLALTVASLRPGDVALADIRNGTASLGLRVGGVAAPHAAAYAAGTVEPLRAGGVTIVDGAPWDTPLTRPTLARVIADLREDHLFTVLDVGDDAGDISHGALARVDRVVVVTTGAADAVAGARRTIQRLHGIDPARAGAAVVVVTGVGRLGRRGRPGQVALPTAPHVVQLPWDPALDLGADLDVERWRRATRAAYLELGAAISGDLAD